LISSAAAAAFFLLAALLGYGSFDIAGGMLTGLLCGTINFCMLAAAIIRISADNSKPSVSKRMIKRSYALRMAFMAAFSIAAIMFLGVNPLAHALMLPLPGIAVRIRRK